MNCVTYLFRPTRYLETKRLDLKRSFYLDSFLERKRSTSTNSGFEDVEFRVSPPSKNASSSSSRQKEKTGASKHSGSILIPPLVKQITKRREEASRTLLLAPSISEGENPCPRYMRHKIERLVGGSVRNVCLTSIVSASKTDIYGAPVVTKDNTRKNLLVEFADQQQMEIFTSKRVGQFSVEKISYSRRLIYVKTRWSQADRPKIPTPLKKHLNSCVDLSSQMKTLTRETELDDAGVRTRFFLCDIIERLLEGIFPGSRIIPFGSTISNLGRTDSDMDVVLSCDNKNGGLKKPEFCFLSNRSDDLESLDERSKVGRQLRLISDIVQTALPGVIGMNRILNARIPIITFKHVYTNICCDMSVQSQDCLIAAELFHAYTHLDPRVRPFLFTLRRWAISQGISNWLTNFPLTCLGLFYLMQRRIVPPMSEVLIWGNIDGAIGVVDRIRWATSTSVSLQDLLTDFFKFYQNFDFKNKAVSPFTGKTGEKLSIDDVEVENPLNRELNCAKLISQQNSFKCFTLVISRSHDCLSQNPTRRSDDGEDWGLTLLTEKFAEFEKERDSDDASEIAENSQPTNNVAMESVLSNVFTEESKLDSDNLIRL